MGIEFLIQLLLTYKYAIIAPAVFVIGAPVSLVAGVLLRLDVLELIPTSLMLAVGELAADVLWYWLGMRYGDSFTERYGKYVGITSASVAYTKQLFERHHDVIIFTSKITAGLGFGTVIMFTAGLSRVPFRRYMMLNIAGQFLWTASLLAIGYSLGHLFIDVSNIFEKMALVALAVIILASIIGFGRYLRTLFY
ncbi:DedA family protein [Candidatus Parcubacteria bacterium]|nr:MAG: DedA family protein [Candidatus Parcubacteria bacterium]